MILKFYHLQLYIEREARKLPRYSDVYCLQCGSNKKMVYDAEISTKNRHDSEKEITVYWCMKCDIIIRIQRQEVHDKVTSVRVTIFKNKK